MAEPVYDHRWRAHTKLPGRFGEPCRVVARGAKNIVLVEFEDGYQVTTQANFIRVLPQPITSEPSTEA